MSDMQTRENGTNRARQGQALAGQRVAALLFSYYPGDPRPRRAAEAMAQLGAKVDLICLRQSATEPQRENFNGVNITRLPIRRRRGGKMSYLWQYGRFIVACFFILAFRTLRGRYRLVHVHNMP